LGGGAQNGKDAEKKSGECKGRYEDFKEFMRKQMKRHKRSPHALEFYERGQDHKSGQGGQEVQNLFIIIVTRNIVYYLR